MLHHQNNYSEKQVYLCQLLPHTHNKNSKILVLPWEVLAVYQLSSISCSGGIKFREASLLLGVFWFNRCSGRRNLGGEREKALAELVSGQWLYYSGVNVIWVLLQKRDL